MDVDLLTLQIILAVTLLQSWKMYLITLNIIAVHNMLTPPKGALLSEEEFYQLRLDTANNDIMKLGEIVCKCGFFLYVLNSDWFPRIWRMTASLTEDTFYRVVLFHVIDRFLIDSLRLLGIMTSGAIFSVPPASLMARANDVVLSMLDEGLYLGVASIFINHFADPSNLNSWIVLAIGTGLLLGCVISPAHHLKKRLTETCALDHKDVQRSLSTIFAATGFKLNKMTINEEDRGKPEANYYSSIGFSGIEVNKSLIEHLRSRDQVAAMVLREVYYWRCWSFPFKAVFSIGKLAGVCYTLSETFANEQIGKIFRFENPPHPCMPMFLAFTFIWPIGIQLFDWFERCCHSQFEYCADVYAAKLSTKLAVKGALSNLAGRSEKYPLFNSWYSVWFTGHSSIFKRSEKL